MTFDQLNLLVDYIDAKIAEHAARNSSDGGLCEIQHSYEILDLLFETLTPNQTTEQ